LSLRKSLKEARPSRNSLKISENVLAPIAEFDNDFSQKRQSISL